MCNIGQGRYYIQLVFVCCFNFIEEVLRQASKALATCSACNLSPSSGNTIKGIWYFIKWAKRDGVNIAMNDQDWFWFSSYQMESLKYLKLLWDYFMEFVALQIKVDKFISETMCW